MQCDRPWFNVRDDDDDREHHEVTPPDGNNGAYGRNAGMVRRADGKERKAGMRIACVTGRKGEMKAIWDADDAMTRKLICGLWDTRKRKKYTKVS